MITLEHAAREYVALLNSQPNGWGQNVHPFYGASHNFLRLMSQEYGQDNVEAAIDAVFLEKEERKMGVDNWLSDMFFTYGPAEDARDWVDMIEAAQRFLEGSPFKVTPEELAEDFLRRV